MARRRSGGAFIGIMALGGVLFFTPAGGWMWDRVQQLGGGCYTALTRLGGSVANPVCGTLSRGIEALGNASASVQGAANNAFNQLPVWADREIDLSSLAGVTQAMQNKLTALASPESSLKELISKGPSGMVKGGGDPFQKAVDGFAVAQSYLNYRTTAELALPWLQQGATLPQGFGLMSQVTLGNLYVDGGSGIDANPGMAQAYLMQALQSLKMLSTSKSPQAQQLLQTLPVSPQLLQQQIEQTLRSMQTK